MRTYVSIGGRRWCPRVSTGSEVHARLRSQSWPHDNSERVSLTRTMKTPIQTMTTWRTRKADLLLQCTPQRRRHPTRNNTSLHFHARRETHMIGSQRIPAYMVRRTLHHRLFSLVIATHLLLPAPHMRSGACHRPNVTTHNEQHSLQTLACTLSHRFLAVHDPSVSNASQHNPLYRFVVCLCWLIAWLVLTLNYPTARHHGMPWIRS